MGTVWQPPLGVVARTQHKNNKQKVNIVDKDNTALVCREKDGSVTIQDASSQDSVNLSGDAALCLAHWIIKKHGDTHGI